MEIDAAVGVASLVIQLCDIFVKIYGKYCDQRDLLIQASDAELDKDLEELRHSAGILSKPPDLPEGRNSDAIMQLQEAIMSVSRSTCTAVDKFSKMLDEMRPKPGQSRVECLFKASKTIFFTNKFESINAEIEALRRRTDFLMASLINEKSTLSLDLQTKILDGQKEQSALSLQARDEIVGIFSVEFESIRKLIVQLKSGRSTAIDSSLPWLQHANPEQSSIPVTSFQSMGIHNGVQSRVQNLPSIINTARQYLHYGRMSERERLIKNAHSTSFHWIFQDHKPDFTAEAFASFPGWLEHGHGCYWIQGKAGAGKSTLMKRIHLHEDTKKHLKRWSGNAEVQIISYFFWYLGSTLQKTLEGMIRALLYNLLTESPQYVITILPELFVEAAKLDQGMNLSPPSLEQLLQWFSQLAKACETTQAFKICFFIDGLDECSDDKEELVKFFVNHGERYKNTKFVLACRPLPVFSDAFSQLPGLRVQDLTRNDIMDYTHTLLSRRSCAVSEEEVDRVTRLISSRSQGVFLWVAVVVQSVLEGLRNGDDMRELQQRIQELPEELTELYKRMLEAIDERYRPQAAAMLLLVATNVDPMHPRQDHALIEPLSAVQFSFAEQGCENAIKAPVEPCTAEELKERVAKLEPRLRSRCLGLLELECRPRHEVTEQALIDSDQRLLGMAVVPFHRTAVEFLVDEEVSTYLREQAGKEFNPFSALFCSCICMVKIASSLFSHPPIKSPAEHSLWTYILFAYSLSYEAERRGAPIEARFMDEFDRAMDIQWKRTADSPIPRRHKNVRWLPALLCNKAQTEIPMLLGTATLSSEVEIQARDLDDEMFDQLECHYQQIGFIRTIALFLRVDDLGTFINDRSPVSAGNATVLLRLLMQTRVSARSFGKAQMYFDEHLRVAISALLQAGADPNATDTEDHNLTIWTRFLVSIFHLLTAPSNWVICNREAGDCVESIVQSFVSHGADLSALVPINDDLAMPSLFMQTMHLLSVEGESIFSQDGYAIVRAKYIAFKESSLRIARILREHEERAGLHSLRHRASRSIRERWKTWKFGASFTGTK